MQWRTLKGLCYKIFWFFNYKQRNISKIRLNQSCHFATYCALLDLKSAPQGLALSENLFHHLPKLVDAGRVKCWISPTEGNGRHLHGAGWKWQSWWQPSQASVTHTAREGRDRAGLSRKSANRNLSGHSHSSIVPVFCVSFLFGFFWLPAFFFFLDL